MSKILPCPNCESESEYVGGSDSNVDTIFCVKCPLEVSHNGMSYKELLSIWNSLPRRKENHDLKCPNCDSTFSEEEFQRYTKTGEYTLKSGMKVENFEES